MSANWILVGIPGPVSVIIVVILQSDDFYISFPSHAGRAVCGLCHSLRPGLLCRNNLDRAWGIFNDQRHVDAYVASWGRGSIAASVSFLEDGRSGCKSGVEYCLWRLLVQVLHLVLRWELSWFHTFSGNTNS